ncbi:MAG: flippase-like domain-containing protein [Gammaproteobacteria bacterium]|nr:flippase-like domain-containing protein [Gammaproteobacteria bacterium]
MRFNLGPSGLRLTAKQKRSLSLSLLFSAIIYLGFALAAGKQSLLNAATTLGGTGWLLILSCSFTSYLLRFLRWQYYLRCLGHHLPSLLHLNYYIAGFALTTTPAKAGETIRSLYLKNHGVSFKHSLASFFCERFQDLIIVTLLASLALLSFDKYRYFVFISALTLLILLSVLRSKKLPQFLYYLSRNLRISWLKHILGYLAALLESAHALLQLPRLYSGLLLGLLAWSIQGLAFYFILTTLGSPLALPLSLAIYAISLLAGALSFIPGGIGATETIMYLLLSQAGVDHSLALVIPIISRVSTLWFAVVLGLLASVNLSLRKDVPPSNEVKPQR